MSENNVNRQVQLETPASQSVPDSERERLIRWLKNQRPSLAECGSSACDCNWCRFDKVAALLASPQSGDGSEGERLDSDVCRCGTNAGMDFEDERAVNRRWVCNECGGHVCYEGELRPHESEAGNE